MGTMSNMRGSEVNQFRQFVNVQERYVVMEIEKDN